MPDFLKVIAKSRDKIIFEGQVLSLTSLDSKGIFDILPKHSNFISIIYDFFQVVKMDKTVSKFPIDGQAVLKVLKDSVSIYLGVTSGKQT